MFPFGCRACDLFPWSEGIRLDSPIAAGLDSLASLLLMEAAQVLFYA